MSAIQFTRATKKRARLRMALIGPAGSGKTYTALAIAEHLGSPVAVLDTEHASASKYSDVFTFDSAEPESFEPEVYIDAIETVAAAGYEVLVIDSLSHAWAGKGGLLEFIDQQGKRSQSGNSFGAWREATPRHNQLVEAILAAPCHIIATMRAKTEFVQEKDERGKTQIRKVGLQPVQRDGLEYEFDVVADLTQDNDLIIGKTRCSALRGKVFHQAGADVAGLLKGWLDSGEPGLADQLCTDFRAAADWAAFEAVKARASEATRAGRLAGAERQRVAAVMRVKEAELPPEPDPFGDEPEGDEGGAQ